MFGVFIKPKDPWEELYDFETNTYFYRHKVTGEFSRNNPDQKELSSEHVAVRSVDPLWDTQRDPETGDFYWSDLETGRVCFQRPEIGTFVFEVPLRDFRRANKIRSKQSSRVSSRKSVKSSLTTKSMRVIRRDDDFGIVSADSSDLNFDELFGANTSPTHFDAGALLDVGSPTAKPMNMRRLSTRDGVETPEFPEVDEETILANSTIATDNPMFQYKS